MEQTCTAQGGGVCSGVGLDEIVWKIERRVARHLIIKDATIETFGNVVKVASDELERGCKCLPPNVEEFVEGGLLPRSNLKLVWSDGDPWRRLYLLIPSRASAKVDTVVKEVSNVLALWNHAYKGRHRCSYVLDDLVAAALHKAVATGLEPISDTPRSWYHGVLLHEYDAADEVKYSGNKTYFRVGNVWIEESEVVCHYPYRCCIYRRLHGAPK